MTTIYRRLDGLEEIEFEVRNFHCVTPCPYVEEDPVVGKLWVGSISCWQCDYFYQVESSLGYVVCDRTKTLGKDATEE